MTGGRLLLEGEGRGRLMAVAYPNAVFVLDVKGRALSGTRYLTHLNWRGKAARPPASSRTQ